MAKTFEITVVCDKPPGLRHTYKVQSTSSEAKKILSSSQLAVASEQNLRGQKPRQRISSKVCKLCQQEQKGG